MNLDKVLTIPFGSRKEIVKDIMKEKYKAYYVEYDSTDTILEFGSFYFAGRKADEAYFHFTNDNKFCRVNILFYYREGYDLKKLIELYRIIKNEINNKYFVSYNDYIHFEPPAYEDDSWESMEANFRKGLVNYICSWNFETENEEDNYITLKINKGEYIEISYEHGKLLKQYLEERKSEW